MAVVAPLPSGAQATETRGAGRLTARLGSKPWHSGKFFTAAEEVARTVMRKEDTNTMRAHQGLDDRSWWEPLKERAAR
ncbi:hypothetical protein [Streptomyces griseoloalbus]|uniref:hypothetical protein n=1 Tax=Streptomyces griseoloalbus TaxID=67303 RepID=UPI001876F2B5